MDRGSPAGWGGGELSGRGEDDPIGSGRRASGEHTPRQRRGAKSRHKLIEATATVVGTHGVDGATVAAIAAQAGMSVGNVYRRFASKDALIRALHDELLAGREGFWDTFLDPVRWRHRSLEELVRAIVEEIVDAHRRHRGLLRALATCARSEYEARMPAPGEGPALLIADRILGLWPDRIRAVDPRRAIALAFEMVSATVGELILFRRGGPEALGLSDEALAEALETMVVAYLVAPAEGRP